MESQLIFELESWGTGPDHAATGHTPTWCGGCQGTGIDRHGQTCPDCQGKGVVFRGVAPEHP